MKILAFESSCDETSCAVVEDGRQVLSDIISTQVPIHKKFGGDQRLLQQQETA